MIYKDQLQAVYRLIEKPENWTQGAYARPSADALFENEMDGDANIANAKSPEATCWCLWGAAHACGIGTASPIDLDFSQALGLKHCTDPNDFNDTHTHAEVLALLQSAIDRAPERP